MMSVLIENCPRCGIAKITFDVKAQLYIGETNGWASVHEVYGVCRNCHRGVIFVTEQKNSDHRELFRSIDGLVNYQGVINNYVKVLRYVSVRDVVTHKTPAYVPDDIAKAFNEGATALSVECWNAAGTMFRMCVDLATRPLLPEGEVAGLNSRTRRDLGLRLPWLFANGALAADISPLAACIKEDGNDGAHAGTLERNDAEDLLDFTEALLERMYTEPGRLSAAQERRDKRRGDS